MRRASIDIGSNSVLLLIADVDDETGAIDPVVERYYTPRLADGLSGTGKLSDQGMARAFDVLSNALQVCEKESVSEIVAVATAAVREASNGAVFVDRIAAGLGLKIAVIDGHEEARLSYLGAVSSFPQTSEKTLVIDVGGASSEFIAGFGECPSELVSIPVGAVKLLDKYGRSPGVDPAAGEELRGLLAGVAGLGKDARVIAVGGTITTLSSLQLGLETYDREAVNGSTVDLAAINNWITRFRGLSLEQIRVLRGMEPERAEVIESGATMYSIYMELARINAVTVSSRGLRFGLLLSHDGYR